MKAIASGPTKRPCTPEVASTGTNTTSTTSVAYSTGPRISTVASRMTSSRGWGASLAAFCRSRRSVFSIPMIASSTSTPSATAKPPRVMVLSVKPKRPSTTAAATSDRGMARKEMAAERQLRRNANSTNRISTPASSSDWLMSCTATSMKLAGRCSAG